jgi:hypothetical protein
MSRIGWKGGRFNVDFETAEIYSGLRDWQRWTGDHVNYYRFYYDESTRDPVYGEASGPLGRIYFGPNIVPALHVIHVEGDNQDTVQGFNYNDSAHVTLSFDQVHRMGIGDLDIATETQDYLRDRFEYRGKIYRVTNIQILGQIQRKPIVITIDGSQIRPNEMVNDLQFSQYANGWGTFPDGYDATKVKSNSMTNQIQQFLPALLSDPAFSPEDDGYGEDEYGAQEYGA